MAKKRKKSSNVIYYVGAAAAAAYFLFKPNAKQEAIRVITSFLPTADPAKLQTMDENYLTAWAYAITNNKAIFPGLNKNPISGAPQISKFLKSSGVSGSSIVLSSGEQKIADWLNKSSAQFDSNQMAFANALVKAALGK
jgi:hypothetical protein